MSRTFALLLSAFALVAMLVAWALFPAAQRGDRANLGLALPQLVGDLNALQTLSFSDVEGTLGFQRVDGLWQFAQLPGLPVNQGKVREFLLDLADARFVEAKTDNAAYHDAIGLGGSATRIILGDGQGLVLGKAAAGSGRFARRIGDDQSYVAKGAAVPQLSLKNWADFDLPVAPRDSVTRVDVNDGEAPYSVVVTPEGQSLEGLKDGEALGYDTVLDTVIAGAVFVDYDGVKNIDEVDWTGAGQTTFYGSSDTDRLVYRVVQDGDDLWLRAAPSGTFIPTKAVDWSKWAFKITDYRKNTLLKPRVELLAAADALEGVADPQ